MRALKDLPSIFLEKLAKLFSHFSYRFLFNDNFMFSPLMTRSLGIYLFQGTC